MKKKILINSLLSLCIIGLLYACYVSIWSEISFDEEKGNREQAVIASLLKIKDAEDLYKKSNKGDYSGTIDSLVNWVKNGRAIEKIIKEGELTDDQLEAGLTEEEAVKQGIIKRDTIWVSPMSLLNITNADSLKLVPVGKEGGEFQLRKKQTYNIKQEQFELLLEVRASMDDYLFGLDEKKIRSLKSSLKKRGKNRGDLMEELPDHTEGTWYGLRIGDLDDPNNKLSGNWE
jgi:hypothetical protein